MNSKGRTWAVGARRVGLTGHGGVPIALGLALVSFCPRTMTVAAATVPTVTIGKAVDVVQFTAVDVALAEGYFKQNGVNVNEVLVSGSSALNAAMIGGSVQFGCENADSLMLARSHGVPIMAVDALDDGVATQVLVSTKWLAKHPIAANATFKQKMASLNGAVLSEVGTTQQAFYGLLRGWAGLPKLEGYRVENLGSFAATAVAIQKGIIDVTVESPPYSVMLTQQGYVKDLVDRKDVPQFNNVAYDVLTTTSSYARQHSKTTTAVATSIAEAVKFMREHPKQTLALDQKHFSKLGTSVLQQSLRLIPFAKDGMQSQEGWDRAVKIVQQTGRIKGITSAPEGVYWTNKYIEKTKLAQ